ncbi:MAG: S41 family peptidase [Bacteroidetes bacterium]|nr:S41 family peptidase [Bacteroidota bacterium]MBU1720478.1 S41 family peptidase [Bacteroidota bacterium]
MKRNKLILAFSSLLAGIGMTMLTAAYTGDNYFEVSKNLDVFASLYKEINLKYVDQPDPGKLMQDAIYAMLANLDPYTNFISEEDIEDYRFLTTGQYGGIGSMIQRNGDYIMISEPYEGFPAQKAGLMAGDIVLEVDGHPTKGKSVEEVSAFLKGQQGTEVTMKIQREGEAEPKEIKVERAEIKIENIPWYGMVDKNTGYIKLTGFTENAGNEVKQAFDELKTNNDLKGIILDLRGNGGGLLKESVNICNIFVKKGLEIVSTKGRMQGGSRTHFTLNAPTDTEIPLVVLVDRGSASASEIVSGAVQDLDRGILIGQRTFGKGLVQNVFPLTYNSQVKITIAKYYIPSGRCIQALDYAHRNDDGSVGKVPDSLITEFQTVNGRKVFDGGGVVPDIQMDEPVFGQISIALIRKNIVFDFATKFRRTHAEIASPEEFKITDEIYNDFVAFVTQREFDYQTKSEAQLEELKKTLSSEKYFEKVNAEYDALLEKMKHNKTADLQSFKEEISMLLKDEIISRYYYQKGRIRASLSEDKEIAKAIETFNNRSKYDSILKGTWKEENK